jgi:hypothetical protein
MVLAAVAVIAVAVGIRAWAADGFRWNGRGGDDSRPLQRPPAKEVTPDPASVRHRPGYDIRPCPQSPPEHGTSWLTPRTFSAQHTEANPYDFRRTRLVDAGPLDVNDGLLWLGGQEYLPAPEEPQLPVPAGTPRVTLLVAVDDKGRSEAAAVEVRLDDGRPVRWATDERLVPATDGGGIAVAGWAAVQGLAQVRGFDELDDEQSESEFWITPCRRFYVVADNGQDAAAALEIRTFLEGRFPSAVGYDGEGRPVVVLVSTSILPWSAFGLPGEPPPEAVEAEPTS